MPEATTDAEIKQCVRYALSRIGVRQVWFQVESDTRNLRVLYDYFTLLEFVVLDSEMIYEMQQSDTQAVCRTIVSAVMRDITHKIRNFRPHIPDTAAAYVFQDERLGASACAMKSAYVWSVTRYQCGFLGVRSMDFLYVPGGLDLRVVFVFDLKIFNVVIPWDGDLEEAWLTRDVGLVVTHVVTHVARSIREQSLLVGPNWQLPAVESDTYFFTVEVGRSMALPEIRARKITHETREMMSDG